MKKSDKDKKLNRYLKLKSEIIRDKVDEIFRTQPDDYIAALEEIGFKYYEDDDSEEIEESNASADNQDQEALVNFFERGQGCSEEILETFFRVKYADQPNFALIRKYFKAANPNLKALIIYGLDHYPARVDLLYDLAYFHEFDNLLSILIDYFTRACKNQMNLETFTDLAREFYFATFSDGFDALYALREIIKTNPEKLTIIDALIREYMQTDDSPGVTEFH